MQGDFFSEFFARLLNISMIGCYTIVVVMVLRALLLRWERKYVYLLWFVVLVNLCIPFRIEGPFSLVPEWIADFDIAGNGDRKTEGKTDYLPNEQIIVTESISHNYVSNMEGGIPGVDSNSETTDPVQDGSERKIDYLPNEQIIVTETIDHSYESISDDDRSYYGVAPGTDANREVTYHQYYTDDSQGEDFLKLIMVLVWGMGVILLAAGNIQAVWKLQRKLRNAEVFSGDCNIGGHVKEEIRIADGIESPFLWGLFSPVIYLPRSLAAEECRYIIAHERYHRKRRDYILKPLFFMIVVIHWFNPLVWAAYFLFVRDMEISCDEAVIANADEDIRKKYAESLLKYAARQNGYTLTPITFGEPSLKCRIQNVLQYREKNMMVSIFVLCAVVVVMAGLVFDPRQEDLMTWPSDLGNAQITQSISDTLTVDLVNGGTVDSEKKDLTGEIKPACRGRKIRQSRTLSDWAKVQRLMQ